MESRALEQLDVIVLDISGSMKSMSSVDPDKTREDVSKVVFHTMVDKMICLEMDHAVGLLAFGATMHPFSLVKNYETFHTELGRLDANQSSTKLFNAIAEAAHMLVAFQDECTKKNNGEVKEGAPMRIFALTDGEDNASTIAPWVLSQLLQQHNIVLDVFPMACSNKILQALCTATGGMCVNVASLEQGIQLFEQESLVHVSCRTNSLEERRLVKVETDFADIVAAIKDAASVTEAPRNKDVATTICKNVMTAQDVAVIAASVNEATSTPAVHAAHAALKRILKEYGSLSQTAPHVEAFLCEGDCSSWKVLLPGPNGSPYEKGHFVLSIVFPAGYPLPPPKVRFLTPIYHCNINHDGAICLDILKTSWTPALTVASVLTSIEALLMEPNVDDPLDSMKATVYREDKVKYLEAAQALTATEASPREDVIQRYHLAQ